MLPLISRPAVASTSRAAITVKAAVRYASNQTGANPHLAVADSRTDIIRQVLYPANSTNPASSSPTGAYHPQYSERVEAVIGDSEAHETIERAWKLFQREKRNGERAALEVKLNAMADACEELDKVTAEGGYPRYIYDRAMARTTNRPVEESKGKKGAEAKWIEARIEGLVPREAWVPTESRGKGWNYDWKRPGSSVSDGAE